MFYKRAFLQEKALSLQLILDCHQIVYNYVYIK